MWILLRRTSTEVSSPFSNTRKPVLAGFGGLSRSLQVACAGVGSSTVSSQRIFLFIPTILFCAISFPAKSFLRRLLNDLQRHHWMNFPHRITRLSQRPLCGWLRCLQGSNRSSPCHQSGCSGCMNGCIGNRGSKGGVATPKESLRQYYDILRQIATFATLHAVRHGCTCVAG